MKKLLMVLAVAVAITLFLAGYTKPALAQEKPMELSMVSFLPDIPPGGNWARLFINQVNKISNGSMKIKFLGPEAIPAPDAPAAVKRGSVDIASALSPFCDALVPGSNSIGRAEYSPMDLRKGPAFKYYQDGFAKVGIYYMGASVSSLPQVQTVLYLRKTINGLADLKGLKIAAAGGSNKAFIEAVGAVCVPIDFPDYFTSMERGTVDGYNIGIPGIQDFSLTPVTKAMLDEPVSSCGGMMIMNMAKYNSLSKAQQDVLNKAMIQTEIDGAKMFTETVEKVKKDIAAAGVKIIHLSPSDSKAFYLAYRNAMWAEDMARWPDIAPKLKGWLVDPNFPRAK
jgi:TRAP-type C4-dicarboxylate transport system substrate-binding protein